MPLPKLTISGHLLIENLPVKKAEEIKRALTLPNPTYYVLLRRGNIRALFNVKKEFTYYADQKGTDTSVASVSTLIVGRGLRTRIQNFLAKFDNHTIEDRTVAPQLACPLKGEIAPRDYQIAIFDKFPLIAKEGIIHLPTGWGKTVLVCELIKRLNLRTLIIVPRDSILAQFEEEFLKYFKKRPGVIKGTKVNIQDVTVASVATLVARPALQERLKDHFGLLIADEAHTFITDKRLELLGKFNARYYYGLTATPERTDEQTEAIFFTFGPIVLSGTLDRISPVVYQIDSGEKVLMDEYAAMVALQVTQEKRNRLIADIANAEIANGRKILILTKRISHYKLLASMIDGVKFPISSGTQNKKRKQTLLDLRAGKIKFDVVLGTYSMLSTGVDIPALDTLIFAGDLKSTVLTTQCSGRIQRLFKDKKEPRIYDITDTLNAVFARQARLRKSNYRKNGWKVVECPCLTQSNTDSNDRGGLPIKIHGLAQTELQGIGSL